jgi:hypothetical protein
MPALFFAALVIVFQLVDRLLSDDILELLAIEFQPIEIVIVLECLCSAASEVVSLASALVRKYGVCEGDLLELLVGGIFVGWGSLVCIRLILQPLVQ